MEQLSENRQESAGQKRSVVYPVVGIPMPGKNWLSRYMRYKYTRCLERAGAVVRILEPAAPEALAEAGERCQGFLFPGGGDIEPKLYEKESLPGCGKTDPAQDAFELSVLRIAVTAQKPLFCIGRGMQLLNVALGGTLMQDIKPNQEYPHMDYWHRASATHPVELDPESLLAKLVASDSITVNSLHHQAVDLLGEGVWIAADSPEGYAEALELDEYPFCLAVQWHPEFMASRSLVQRKLFQGFVDACRKIE